MKKVLHDPETQCDIFGAVRFYEERQPGLGTRFVRAVDETVAKIASAPQRFAYYERPLRSCRIPGFPYRILFADEPEFVLVVAVSHLARMPGWWRQRLEQ